MGGKSAHFLDVQRKPTDPVAFKRHRPISFLLSFFYIVYDSMSHILHLGATYAVGAFFGGTMDSRDQMSTSLEPIIGVISDRRNKLPDCCHGDASTVNTSFFFLVSSSFSFLLLPFFFFLFSFPPVHDCSYPEYHLWLANV